MHTYVTVKNNGQVKRSKPDEQSWTEWTSNLPDAVHDKQIFEEIQAGCKGSMNDCEFGLDLDNSFFDDTGESDVEDVDPLESDTILGNKAKPVHPYTNMSVFDFCVQFLDVVRNGLFGKKTVTRLLTFMAKTYPQPSYIPRSFQSLMKIVSVEKMFEKEVFCSDCWKSLDGNDRCICVCDNPSGVTQEVFTVNVEKEVSGVIKRCWPAIFDYEAKACNTPPLCGRDIASATAYQQLLKKKKKRHRLTLLLSADGVPLCVSNSKAAWVFSAAVVEIPPEFRYTFQNMLLLQYSIGLSKPNLSITMVSVIKQLVELSNKGVVVKINGIDVQFEFSCLLFTADSPALSLFCNFIATSGLSACYVCTASGKYSHEFKKVLYSDVGHSHRTLDDYYQTAIEARAKRQISRAKKDPAIRGIKGFSVLEPLFPQRMLISIRPDYMHTTIKCVFDSSLDLLLQILGSHDIGDID
ncbi:unnamed protein product, partial [Didymodactylos carnosus]